MFSYSALSTGIALIEDTENVGTGIRIDYGYSDANKFRLLLHGQMQLLNH
jgi:hypothetical protein